MEKGHKLVKKSPKLVKKKSDKKWQICVKKRETCKKSHKKWQNSEKKQQTSEKSNILWKKVSKSDELN